MKPCQVEGCEKPAGVPGTARGWCSTHYSRSHWAVVQRVTDDRGARLGREIPGTCSPAQLVARVDLYANHCWMCGAEATEIDHVKPLSAGGSNWPANLRPACHPCNRAKSNHWPLRSAA